MYTLVSVVYALFMFVAFGGLNCNSLHIVLFLYPLNHLWNINTKTEMLTNADMTFVNRLKMETLPLKLCIQDIKSSGYAIHVNLSKQNLDF
jgi:hypothetical protein